MTSAAQELDGVLDEFIAYLNDGSAWSNQAWRTWQLVFSRFGVEGETASELLTNAREVLSRVR